MGQLTGFGIPSARLRQPNGAGISHVLNERALHRVLRFTGHSIDDVVNDPIAKREVLGYYKLHQFVQRRCEIGDLERQWNAVQ